jgi:23S rRNA pseudouridine2457 synthase
MGQETPVDYQYLLFYKPYNVLSQFTPGSSGSGGLTLGDFIAVAGVYPVGRLDQDSEGLMLLTNDGRVQHRLSHPRYGHSRTYWVQVEGIPSSQALAELRQGVRIKDYQTRPCQVALGPTDPPLPPRVPPIRYRQHIPTTWLTITLQEGKNRQVRRMTAAVGYPTLRLVRQAIAGLTLDQLCPGDWRYLTARERARIQKL